MSERIPILVRPDHLAQLSNARTPLDALAELIWNAFDADATKVVVSLEENALGALDVIRITDNGHGIFQPDAKKLFGDLGDSWKKAKRRTDGGRGIHGKNGKGRFKAFYLGASARWQTTFRALDSKLYDYAISGDLAKLEGFDVSDPRQAKGTTTGSEVVIQNPHRNFRSLLEEEARLATAQLFGAYLTEYPFVELVFNGERVDPKAAQERTAEVKFDAVMPNGGTLPVSLRIIEWKQDTDRMLHLCDGGGVSLTSQIFLRGYAVTSYGSQGKTVDKVIFSDAGTRAATSAEQWYVTISRGRTGVVIFTPDKAALRANIQTTAEREMALDLKSAPTEAIFQRPAELTRRGIKAAEFIRRHHSVAQPAPAHRQHHRIAI